MKVHSKILKDLSSGIYSNPANAIKELVVNSYDADATNVTIRAKPDLDSFTIIDDGIGMNCDDFETKFVWISHSEKRKHSNLTEKYKRPLVGRFGIGFISASQLCDKMTIISSKKGEDKKFKAVIDFSEYKSHKDYEDPKEIYDVSKFDFVNSQEEREEHYTIIILSELSPEFIDFLTDREIEEKLNEMDKAERKKNERINFENISFKEIINRISEENVLNIEKKVGTYWQFVLDLANTVPVPYLDKGPLNISHENSVITEITSDLERYNFTVDIDGIILQKPILLPNRNDITIQNEDYNIYGIDEEIEIDDKKLKFRGYIYNQRKQIEPVDFQGVLIRIRNVAIGKPDRNFLDYPWSEKMYMTWTYGEIYVDEGLEEALNINRNSFSVNNPHYMYLKKYLHDLLHDIVFKNARTRYTTKKKIIAAHAETERKNNISQIVNAINEKKGQRESEDIPKMKDKAENQDAKANIIYYSKIKSQLIDKKQLESKL